MLTPNRKALDFDPELLLLSNSEVSHDMQKLLRGSLSLSLSASFKTRVRRAHTHRVHELIFNHSGREVTSKQVPFLGEGTSVGTTTASWPLKGFGEMELERVSQRVPFASV